MSSKNPHDPAQVSTVASQGRRCDGCKHLANARWEQIHTHRNKRLAEELKALQMGHSRLRADTGRHGGRIALDQVVLGSSPGPAASTQKPRTRGFFHLKNEGRPRKTALAEERNDALRPGAVPLLLRHQRVSSLGIGSCGRLKGLRATSSCGSGNDRQHARRRLSGGREAAVRFYGFATLSLAGRIRLVA
jgi:hypothetical protein